MIPLYKPYMPQLPILDEILHSGQLSYGTYTKEFETKLREFFSTPFVLAISSFESAIQIMMSALDIEKGGEVISSPMACLASTQPYKTSGFEVRWADVDPKRGTLDPESVKRRITSNTKAIIHNHFCGYPGYIEEINNIGKEYGIPVIDDGIECFGSEYKGRKIGCCGSDATVFSLNPVRIPNCISGGIIIFKEKKFFDKAVLLRDSGIDRSVFRDEIGEISSACDITLNGYSATMSNVNGYIGSCQMDKVDRLLSKQRDNAHKWKKFLMQTKELKELDTTYTNPNYWVYGLRSDKKRETIKKFRDNGYYASGVHIMNSIYSVFGSQEVELPGVYEFYNSFVAIPSGWWVEDDSLS